MVAEATWWGAFGPQAEPPEETDGLGTSTLVGAALGWAGVKTGRCSEEACSTVGGGVVVVVLRERMRSTP